MSMSVCLGRECISDLDKNYSKFGLWLTCWAWCTLHDVVEAGGGAEGEGPSGTGSRAGVGCAIAVASSVAVGSGRAHKQRHDHGN